MQPRPGSALEVVETEFLFELLMRLLALALTRSDQTRDIEGAHRPPCPMRQVGEKRLKPALEIALPFRSPPGHVAPPAFQNAGAIADGSIRSNQTAKVVLTGPNVQR